MADTNKKEYTSNLHPKGDLGTTVYPNVKSENIIDKDTTAYTAGKVPDSSLVSKSLDGISENFETTKIQVDTNKTNIATLQGDVSSLKQDNQTTKTTIAGLVSADTTNKENIAKNTQDIATNAQNIENLSDVMPTDINVDENYNYILEHDGTEITGQKKLFKATFISNINNNTIYSVFSKNNNKYTNNIEVTLQNAGQSYLGSIYFRIKKNRYDFIEIGKTSSGEGTAYISSYIDGYSNKRLIFGKSSQKGIYAELPDKSGTLALTSDVDAKQSTLYRHTVLISTPTNKTAYLAFTAESEKNTIIDSIQDLITVFGNTSIACSGIFRDGDPANSQSLLMINIGTSISDTTIAAATFENNAITDFSNASFTDTFGTTGFTITDNVTAM